MSWTIRVYDTTGATLRTEAVNGVLTANGSLANEGTVALRGFDPAIVTPPGASKLLNLYVRNDAMQVLPRSIVQMLIDDTPVFWGPAIISPWINTPGAGPFDADRDALERVTVVGGEQLLRDSVIGARLIETNTEVSAIAYEFCSLFAHPALVVDEANFVDTGGVLSTYYAPENTLYAALEFFASTIPFGATFWVDATGAVRFEANVPAGS